MSDDDHPSHQDHPPIPASPQVLSGICDACGKEGVDLYKVSLGKDFFNRTYDRLSHTEDLHPKWFCSPCSLEKGYQRDVRSIHQELEKLVANGSSLLSEETTLLHAISHVEKIEKYVKKGRKIHVLLPPREVGLLLIELQQVLAARLPTEDTQH
ncbi:MAG: hypothetical protein ACYCXP_07685 [Leptospirillum sp.]|nr:hypothetical protein [Nitrospiraceae bacterium]